MCGIVGYVNDSGNDIDLEVIERMLNRISHRGPDARGVWTDETRRTTLGHNRLSILDLSEAGRQPMMSESGRYVITYNGEVYNFRELRQELKANGHRFRSETDTEVILEAFEEWGVESVEKFHGMFALGVVDRKEKQLILIRDRVGIKPLYYGWIGRDFVFSSDLGVLKYYPNFSKEIDRGALKRYVRLGYIPAPQSIYNNFYKLIPGTYLRVMLENFNSDKFSPYPSSQDISFCPHYYWNPAVKMAERFAAQDGFDYSSGKQSFKRVLQEAIEAHLVSDVPVGSFLSGGIDSSLVTAIMKEVSPSPVKTFTIGFGDSKYNEADYARKIAAFLGTDHTEMYVTERDALNVVVKLPYIYSEPFADSSQIPTLMLSELTRNSVTVALSGDGGDELFGGYERYIVARNIWEVSRLLPVGIKKLLYNFFQRLPESVYPYLLKPFTYIVPRDLHKKVSGSIYENGINVALSPCKKSLYLNQVSQQYQPGKLVKTNEEEDLYPFTSDFCLSASLVENFQAIDFLTYLPEDILCKVDRASMAVSLETRIPLLDHKVVEYAWTVPSQFKLHKNESKILLRDLLSDYLPRELYERPKQGFGVPICEWLRHDLKDWAMEELSDDRLAREGCFNSKQVSAIWKDHLAEKHDWSNQLWTILMFQQWLHK